MDCHFSPVDSLPESFPAAWDKLYNADAAHQEQALTSYLALGNSVEMSLRGSSDDSRVTISLVGIAARAGKASLVRLLHAAGAKLQSADPERFQLSEPLEIAAYCMNKDMVALLLDLGANPSSGYPIHAALYDRHRFPAFESVAAFSGVENSIKESARRQEIVKLLIKSGAYPGKPAWGGSPPIHCCCFFHLRPELELLLDAGADINALSSGGWSLLHYACTSARYWAEDTGPKTLAYLGHLIDRGANPCASQYASESMHKFDCLLCLRPCLQAVALLLMRQSPVSYNLPEVLARALAMDHKYKLPWSASFETFDRHAIKDRLDLSIRRLCFVAHYCGDEKMTMDEAKVYVKRMWDGSPEGTALREASEVLGPMPEQIPMLLWHNVITGCVRGAPSSAVALAIHRKLYRILQGIKKKRALDAWEAGMAAAVPARARAVVRWRHAGRALEDRDLAWVAASEGRPMELARRLKLGKLAGALVMRSKLEGAGEEVSALEAARLGGHGECVKLLEEAMG